MRTIDPHLFTRLMRLPPSRRVDLLEFIGATPLADLQLEHLIDMLARSSLVDARSLRQDVISPAGTRAAPPPVTLN